MQIVAKGVLAGLLFATQATAVAADSGLDGTVKLSHGRNFDADFSATIFEGSLAFSLTDSLFVQADAFGNRYTSGSSSSSNAAALHLGYQVSSEVAAGVFFGREDWGYGVWQIMGAEVDFATGAVESEFYFLKYQEDGGTGEGDRYGLDIEIDLGSGGSMGEIDLIAGAHFGSGDYNRTYAYLGAATTLNNGVTLEAKIADNDGQQQAFVGVSFDFGDGAQFNRRGWHSFQGIF